MPGSKQALFPTDLSMKFGACLYFHSLILQFPNFLLHILMIGIVQYVLLEQLLMQDPTHVQSRENPM